MLQKLVFVSDVQLGLDPQSRIPCFVIVVAEVPMARFIESLVSTSRVRTTADIPRGTDVDDRSRIGLDHGIEPCDDFRF
jgi:hypothetical protein